MGGASTPISRAASRVFSASWRAAIIRSYPPGFQSGVYVRHISLAHSIVRSRPRNWMSSPTCRLWKLQPKVTASSFCG